MKSLKLIVMMLLVPALAMAGAPGGAPAARVVTAEADMKILAESTSVVGYVHYDRVSVISAEVSGLVASAGFRSGDTVKKGDVLIRLNTDFIDIEIDVVESRIAQVDVQIKKASKDLTRYETLFRQEAASEKEFDDMALSRENLLKQRAILEQELSLAKLKKRKSVIRSPFDGLVLEKTAEKGNWVSPGSGLCRVASLDDLIVKVPVAEGLVSFSKKGEKVPVTIKALGLSLTGEIDGIDPVADSRTKNVFVKIRLPRMDRAAENMSAVVFVPAAEKRSMVLVPRDSLVSFNGNRMVYVVGTGVATPVPVKVLAYEGGFAGIVGEGIEKGTPVVVDGNDRLRPGQPVTVIGQQ